ncbi:MAG: membrane protein insertase YidC [Pseudomonadota bacterium]
MDNTRLLLSIALVFIALLLWENWQADYARPVPAAPAQVEQDAPASTKATVPVASDDTLPALTATPPPASPAAQPQTSPDDFSATQVVEVTTDVFNVEIDLRGGGLKAVALTQYPVSNEQAQLPTWLLRVNEDFIFVNQGGLISETEAPTHLQNYQAKAAEYFLDAEMLEVPLTWRSPSGLSVTKTLRFKRGSYEIQVSYQIENGTAAPWQGFHYEQFKKTHESSRQGMVYTFNGAVLSVPDKPFEKFDYDDLQEEPLNVSASGGWVGVMQHYFVSALVPPYAAPVAYRSDTFNDERYLVGFTSAEIMLQPGESATAQTTIYVGPKRHDILPAVAPGLDLTVDYGFLWFIAKPLFIALAWLRELSGNWGWAIVILTLIIKLFFYPLSAAGYRSMAHMRRVQPRLLAIRDRYKDDKTRLNQAMMDLYKEEKINPLGGCLPILIQIPVFIALYWVLLESVEIRQAPFVLWIDDLSEKDPLFVLPLLMGVSMWVQQKLNPAPMDPVQQKVMQLLPWVFTVFFAFFPSGLVLYWVINNVLSIAQQWRITQVIERTS